MEICTQGGLRGAIVTVAIAAAMVCLPQNAGAQAKFQVNAYNVLGNQLLDPQTIDNITRQHTGAQSDFETIQRAVEALEQAYVAAGFGAVRVEVPEQELESGVVTLQVVEGKIGRVTVENNPHFDADNLRRSLPALREGESINTNALNRNIQLTNEGGAKSINVTFKRSENQRDVDANVKLIADDPQRWLVLMDNTGSAATGAYRLGVVYQHANLFNRDHALSAQLMSSPGYWSQVRIAALGYRIPFYSLGSSLDLNASYSSVDSGQVVQAGGGPDLAISGGGTTFGIRYTHALEPVAEFTHKLSFGLENRAYGNNVKAAATSGASLVPDLGTRPFILGYSANWFNAKRDTTLSLNLLHNLSGANNGSTADFNQPGGRAGADAAFKVMKLNLHHTERWASQWSLRAALAAQVTNDMLISAEQFGAGGNDSVRGFREHEVSGDTGARVGLELWAAPVDLNQWRLIPIAFADVASVRRNNPAPGEIDGQTIASAGIGLRASYGRGLSIRLDWAHAIRGVADTAGTQAGNQKLHASAIWMFQ